MWRALPSFFLLPVSLVLQCDVALLAFDCIASNFKVKLLGSTVAAALLGRIIRLCSNLNTSLWTASAFRINGNLPFKTSGCVRLRFELENSSTSYFVDLVIIDILFCHCECHICIADQVHLILRILNYLSRSESGILKDLIPKIMKILQFESAVDVG